MAPTRGAQRATGFNIPEGLSAVAILLVGVALRVWGQGWGLPDAGHLFSYHPDEYHSLRGLFSIASGSLNPHFFNYGSLYLYLVAAAAAIAHGFDYELAEALRLWTLDARVVSVLAALATMLAVYWLGRRLFGKAALLAAALLATMPLHVLNSHYGTVDVTQTLFVTLCLLFSVRIVQQGRWQDCLWAGIMAGLAASTKYNGAAVAVAPIVAVLVRAVEGPSLAGPRAQRGTTVATRMSLLLFIVLGAGLAFLLTSPYTLLAWNEAKRDILFEIQHMGAGEPLAVLAEPSGLLFHLKNLLAPGVGPVLVLAATGMVMVAVRRGRSLYPLVVFVIVWMIMISLAKVRYARYEVALLPALAVLGTVPVVALLKTRGTMRAAGYLVATLCLGVNVLWSLEIGKALAGSDPRAEALHIVLQQTPPDARVGLIQEPWFDIPPVDYCNGGRVIRNHKVWRSYHRPRRPLVVTGLSDAALRDSSPHTFVLSEFAVRDGLRGGDAQVSAFTGQLLRDYEQRGQVGGLPLTGVPWAVGLDWLYPWPEIQVYVHR